MATITSSILALLAAAPEPPEAEVIPTPVVESVDDTESASGPEIPSLESESGTPDPNEEGDAAGTLERDEYRGGLVVDRFGPLDTVDVRNIAGSSIPTSLPSAYPRGPSIGFIPGLFERRARLSARGGGPTPPGKWGMTYSGFLRAPFRAAVAERRPPTAPGARAFIGDRAPGQSKYSLHDPAVPDDQYLGYGYTRHTPRDWAELYLTYGNGIVAGTVSLQGFNFTDAAWKEEETQFGITQGYVTLTPKLKPQWVNLKLRVGSFFNLYGLSGRYDQGEIETYLFGRTHMMGETLTAHFQLNPDFKLWVEHGIGTTRPDPQIYNAGRFTVMHHAHVGFRYQNKLEFNVHWLNTFTQEAERLTIGEGNDMYPFPGTEAGRMHVVGPELRVDWGRLGFIYAGFSFIDIKNGTGLSRAHEIIHSMGGGQFRHGINYIYLGGADSGRIYSVIGQLENSIQKIRLGSNWWGQGPDLVAKFYFMVNKVTTDVADADIVRPSSESQYVALGGADGDLKYKVGFDLLARPLAWLGIGARVTHVSPDSDYKEQQFTILSPRLQFRTNFLSHEIIELQYSRYFYNERTCPGMPAGMAAAPLGNPVPSPETSVRCVQPPRNPVAPTGFGTSPNTQPEGLRGPVALPGPHPYAADVNVIMLLLTMWW